MWQKWKSAHKFIIFIRMDIIGIHQVINWMDTTHSINGVIQESSYDMKCINFLLNTVHVAINAIFYNLQLHSLGTDLNPGIGVPNGHLDSI